MNLLAQKDMVTRLPPPDNLYEGCGLEKHHRGPLGKSRRATKPLELVHTDICCRGWISWQKEVLLTFCRWFEQKELDLFSEEKSEAFEKLKEFKAFVEKQSGFVLKILGSNRGGKFTFNEFANYSKKERIHWQLTYKFYTIIKWCSEEKE